MDQDKAREIVYRGEKLEELLEHEGWQVVLEHFIAKGLDRQRFLGSRPGKLMWQQGFQAALDAMLRFIDSGIKEKDKILSSVQ